MKHLSFLTCIALFLIVSVAFGQSKRTGYSGPIPKSNGPIVRDLNSPAPDSLIAATLFGSCVEIRNFHITSPFIQSMGIYSDSLGLLGFNEGLVMTSGMAVMANGPNSTGSIGYDIQAPGDYMLDNLVPQTGMTRDAVVLDFDFIPLADTIYASQFVFGSEEYPEYVNSSFNDVFAFWISGPGIINSENLAMVPGTTDPISVNTINAQATPAYFWANDTGITSQMLQYDGFTVPIPLYKAVTPLDTYHFRIAIADVSDGIYDSGVFIKKGSFCGNTALIFSGYIAQPGGGNTVNFTNTSGHAEAYFWDFGDGTTSIEENPTHTFPDNGVYNVSLVANNICKSDTFAQALDLVTVGLNEAQTKMKLDFYPNGEGAYSLHAVLTNYSPFQLEVLNGIGQVVYSETQQGRRDYHTKFDLSTQAQGVYFVRVQTNGESKLVKFVR
jgi:hypothetical protein